MYEEIKKNYSDTYLIKPESDWPVDVARALIYINNQIFDHDLTISRVREECYIPNNNFSTRFRYYVGNPPVTYIKKHRIECSKVMFLEKSNSVSIIGFEVGYRYPSTFTCAFKDITGSSPKQFRDILKQKVKEKNEE